MIAKTRALRPFVFELALFVRNIPLSRSVMKRVAESVWRAERGPAGQISIAVVGDRRMAGLTQRYTGRRYRTDVLAFELSNPNDRPVVAQVIVNAAMARATARKLGINPAMELALYIVHGLLHLRGYDDHTVADARRMHGRALHHLRRLGFDVPRPHLPM